jgi:hypothetical protein
MTRWRSTSFGTKAPEKRTGNRFPGRIDRPLAMPAIVPMIDDAEMQTAIQKRTPLLPRPFAYRIPTDAPANSGSAVGAASIGTWIVDDGLRAGEVIESIRAMFKNVDQEKTPIDINKLVRDTRAHPLPARAPVRGGCLVAASIARSDNS